MGEITLQEAIVFCNKVIDNNKGYLIKSSY